MNNRQMLFSLRQKRSALARVLLIFVGGFVLSPVRVAHAQLEEKLQSQFDLFVGKNITGPYTLSWNHLLVSKDVVFEVVVDGQKLKADAYSVDATKGLLSFTRILSDKSVARVTYTFDPKIATRNANAISSPLAVPVTRFGQNTLSLIALPGSAAANSNGSPPLVLGVNGKTNLFGGGLTSDFKMAGENKTGIRLGFVEGNDRNGVDVQVARVNKEFATAYGSALGMGDATQRVALATRLAPSRYMRTNYAQSETINLLTNEHKDSQSYSLGLGGVGNTPLLRFSRSADLTIAPDKSETNVATNTLDLSARFDKLTSVKATSVETLSGTKDPNAATTARNNSVTLTSSADGGAKQATATVNSSSKESKASLEQNTGVTVRLQPGPGFVVSASQSEQKAIGFNPDGTKSSLNTVLTQTAGAEIAPVPGTRVTSSVVETTNNAIKTSVTNFGAQVGVGKKIEISTGVVNRSTEATGKTPLDTTSTRIALRPIHNLTLIGGYTWNPEDNGLVRQALRQEIGLAANLGAIELGSNYMLTTLNGLTTNDLVSPQYGAVSLSLGLRFSSYTRLTGSYKDSLRYGANSMLDASLFPQYLRSYGIGLTHNLGSSLNFSLGGTRSEDRSKGNVPPEIKGEAKLGIHF